MGKSEYASRHLKLAFLNAFVVHYVGNHLGLACAGETFCGHPSNVPGWGWGWRNTCEDLSAHQGRPSGTSNTLGYWSRWGWHPKLDWLDNPQLLSSWLLNMLSSKVIDYPWSLHRRNAIKRKDFIADRVPTDINKQLISYCETACSYIQHFLWAKYFGLFALFWSNYRDRSTIGFLI